MRAEERQPGEVISELQNFLAALDRDGSVAAQALTGYLETVNPIDLARALVDFDPDDLGRVFDFLDRESQAVVLSEADPRDQAVLLLHVGDRGAELIANLEPDDAADVLETLQPPEREHILRGMAEPEAREIRELTVHDSETAGGLMTPEFFAVSAKQTVQEVLDLLRRTAHEAEVVNNLYVLEGERLVGVFSLRELILADVGAHVDEFMSTELRTALVDQDREEVLRVMETYHLSILPVVDSSERLLGIVTFDDALTAMEEEGSEDVMTLAGAGAGDTFPTHQTVGERVKARLPWLTVTLLGGLGCAWIVPMLHDLMGGDMPGDVGGKDSLFFVMIAGMAGSVAIQSAAIMVRGFATGEIGKGRTRQIIRDETLVGASVGAVVGVSAGLLLLLFGVEQEMAISVAVALLAATTIGAAAGTMIPSFCRWIGVDPAISAGPFLTALNDVLGITIFVTVTFWVRGMQG